MTIRKALAATVGLCALATASACTQASSEQSTGTIRFASAAPVTDSALFKIAENQGFLKEQGVKLEVQDLQGGSRVLAALLSGSLDCGKFASPVVENALAQGAKVKWVAVWLPVADAELVVADGVASYDALVGKALGVSNAGTISNDLTTLALRQKGVEPGKDVTLRSLGDQSASLSSFVSGQIAGSYFGSPVSLVAKQKTKGSTTLLDFRDGPSWPGGGLACTTDFVEKHEADVVNLLRALVDSIEVFKTDEKVAKAAIAETIAQDATIVDGAYERLQPVLLDSPMPKDEMFVGVLEQLVTTNPAAANIKPGDTYDAGPLTAAMED